MGRGARARGEPAAEERRERGRAAGRARARVPGRAAARRAPRRENASGGGRARAARRSRETERTRRESAHRDANRIPEFENASEHARRAGEGERRGRGAGDDVTTRTMLERRR